MGAGLRDVQPGSRRRHVTVSVTAAAVTALVCGCGHTSPAKTALAHRHLTAACTSGALAAMARTLGVATASIDTAASTANNEMPQCAFTTRLHGKHVEMTVNVDNGPQPYFVLERTIVEAAQIFPVRASPAPTQVAGLGLEASWFPAETHLQATDGLRLITATVVKLPGAGTKNEVRVARAMTATYLKTPHGKAAAKLAKGYPAN
ncbi:MAG TPA: hypothetical protein VHX66_16525 [Solirubrobacteraceae bacterium]|jgi:hypothetical protein|nr:hypothetical protein [Solirubrobacteraceae bacterium]